MAFSIYITLGYKPEMGLSDKKGVLLKIFKKKN